MTNPNQEKVVFFLGTGASRAFNPSTPLDREFLDRILIRLSGNSRRGRKEWDEAYSEIKAFLQEHYRGRRAQLWDALMLLDKVDEEHGDPKSTNLRTILESQIQGVASDVAAHNFIDHWNAIEFVNQLQARDWQIDFVTTNYDLTIDGYIPILNKWKREDGAGGPIGYNLMYDLNGMRRLKWSILNTPQGQEIIHPKEPSDIPQPPPNCPRGARLFKIHGSVNWAYCRVCKTPFLIDGAGAAESMSLLQPPPCPGQHAESPARQPNLERALMTPAEIHRKNGNASEDKRGMFIGLWEEAAKTIAAANLLIFIGYSMPPEDRQVREWVAKANANAPQNRHYKVLVITLGDDPRLHESYESLFGDEVKIYNRGLTKFIEEGLLTNREKMQKWLALTENSARPLSTRGANS